MDLAPLVAPWTVVTHSVGVTTAATKLCDANPRRYAIGIGVRQDAVHPTPADEYIELAIEPGVNLGGIVIMDNDTKWYTFKDQPGWVNAALYAFAHTANPFVTCYIVEIIQSSVPDR